MQSFIDKIRQVATYPSLEIDYTKAALMLIDMQHYQIRDGAICKSFAMMDPGVGDYYLDRVNSIVEPNCIKLLQHFRDNNARIIFSRYGSNHTDESDLQPWMRDANEFSKEAFGDVIIPQLSNPNTDIVPSLEPNKSEIILQKSRSGCFTNTELEQLLNDQGIEQLVVIGVLTHACVENTARVARDIGYDVVVVDDACGTIDPKIHDNAITSMATLSIYIMQTADFV